jgi:hypothetical protein
MRLRKAANMARDQKVEWATKIPTRGMGCGPSTDNLKPVQKAAVHDKIAEAGRQEAPAHQRLSVPAKPVSGNRREVSNIGRPIGAPVKKDAFDQDERDRHHYGAEDHFRHEDKRHKQDKPGKSPVSVLGMGDKNIGQTRPPVKKAAGNGDSNGQDGSKGDGHKEHKPKPFATRSTMSLGKYGNLNNDSVPIEPEMTLAKKARSAMSGYNFPVSSR